MCSTEVNRARYGNLPNHAYLLQYMTDSYSSMPQTWSDCAISMSAPARNPLTPGPVPLSLEQELTHSHDPNMQSFFDPAMQFYANDYSQHFEAVQPYADGLDQNFSREAPEAEEKSTDRELEARMRNAVAKFLEDPGCESDETDEDELVAKFAEVSHEPHVQEKLEFAASSALPAPQPRSSIMTAQMPAGFALETSSYTSPKDKLDKSPTAYAAEISMGAGAEEGILDQAARMQVHDASLASQHGYPSGAVGQSLVFCLRELLLNGSIPHDIQVVAEDGSLGAHHFILTERSSFFKSRLQGGYVLEPWEPLPQFKMSGVTVTALRHILLYIYTDTCDIDLEGIMASSSVLSSVDLLFNVYCAAAAIGLTRLKSFLVDHILGPIALHLPALVNERLRRAEPPPSASAETPNMHSYEVPIYPQEVSNMASSSEVQGLDPAMLNTLSRIVQAENEQRSLDTLSRIVQEEDQARSLQMDMAPTDAWFSSDQVGETSSLDVAPVPSLAAFPKKADWDESKNDLHQNKLAASILKAGATTLMIRNLPRTLKQKKFINELNASGFVGTYDFAYLPSVFGKGFEASGLGYAFVNFTDPDAIVKFANSWHGSRRFNLAKTDSAITVAPAEHQGREINVEKWLRKGCRVRNPELRPYVRLDQPFLEDPDNQNFFDRLVAAMPGLRSSLPEVNGPSNTNESRGVERTGESENDLGFPPGVLEREAEANLAE